MSGGFLPSSSPREAPPTPPVAPSSPELTPLQADELALEHLQEEESAETFLEQDPPAAASALQAQITTAAVQTPPVAAPVKKDETVLEVEKILEDGLGDFVASMPDAPKARFMQLGQQIAAQIALMVRGYKVKVRTVIHLIREWLLVIPGVNAFFLEQEAKIKTDRILAYEQQYHDAHSATP